MKRLPVTGLGVLAGLSVAVAAAGAGTFRPPRIDVESHGVRASGYPLYCANDEPCTRLGPAPLARQIPVHVGGRVRINVRAPARALHVRIYAGPRYAYARKDDRAGRVWSFRVPRGGARRVDLGVEIRYPQGHGALRFFVKPHRHTRTSSHAGQ